MGKNKVKKGRIVFWSVLGTSVYGEADYVVDGRSCETDLYVQCALMEYLKAKHPDLVFKIFLTKKARDSNWEKRFEGKPSEKVEKEDGLKYRLEKRYGSLFDWCDEVDIQDGNNDEQIWSNFNSFYGALEENDRVYVDITHSFRSIPVLLLSVLEMAKKTKNITVEDIFYGTYERDNKAKGNKDLVISMGAYDQITEWSNAIRKFLETGYAKDLHQIVNHDTGKVMQGVVISSMEEKDLAIKIKKLNDSIKTFSEMLLSVRGIDVVEGAKAVKKAIEDLNGKENHKEVFQPFYRVLDQIGELFKQIQVKNTYIENTNGIVRLCIHFGLYQQGFTFLSENIISYVCCRALDIFGQENKDITEFIKILDKYRVQGDVDWKRFGEAKEDKNYIRKIRELLSNAFEEKFREDKKGSERNSAFSKSRDWQEQLASLRENVQDLRNDMNHAGFRDSAAGYNKLRGNLEDNLKWFEEIVACSKTGNA